MFMHVGWAVYLDLSGHRAAPCERDRVPQRLKVAARAVRGNRRIEEHSQGVHDTINAGPLQAGLRLDAVAPQARICGQGAG